MKTGGGAARKPSQDGASLNNGRVNPGGGAGRLIAALLAAAFTSAAALAQPAAAEPAHEQQLAAAATGDARPLGSPSASGSRQVATANPEDAGGVGKKPAVVGSPGLAQVAGALGFVLAVIILVFKAIRRGARARGGLMAAAGPGGRAPSGVLSVLGRYPLARGQTLLLLKLERRVLLVAQTAGSRTGPALATLTEVDDPEAVAAIAARCEEQGEGAARFSVSLEQFEAEHAAVDGRAGTQARSLRERLNAWRGLGPEGSAA